LCAEVLNFPSFQFSAGGIVKIPKFEMMMSKSEANNKPVLAADDVHIVTVYALSLLLISFGATFTLTFFQT